MLSCLVPRFGQEEMPSKKFDLQCKLNHFFPSHDTDIFIRSKSCTFPLPRASHKSKEAHNILGKVVVKNGRKHFLNVCCSFSFLHFQVSLFSIFSIKKLCTHLLATYTSELGKNVIVSIEKPDRNTQWGIATRWSFGAFLGNQRSDGSDCTRSCIGNVNWNQVEIMMMMKRRKKSNIMGGVFFFGFYSPERW